MAAHGAGSAPSRFRVRVPDALLDDLRARLERVRWPGAPTPGWDHGADVEAVRDLVGFWRDGFDWRRQERLLDERLPSERARLRGLDLHFARVPGRGPRPFPLLLLHGWPGSYFEMIEVAGPLADPAAHGGDAADAFDLVVPSLPGHGFSDAPRDPLFGAQGGDRGAFVAAGLGHRHPAHVAAIHLNLATGIPAPQGSRPPEEERWLAAQARWQQEEGGYSAIQSTRPQTLA